MSGKIHALHPAGYTSAHGAPGGGYLCLECLDRGVQTFVPSTDDAPARGCIESICDDCYTADLERADRQLAERLAEVQQPALDPDDDVRTHPIHLDALAADVGPSDWLRWSAEDEELHNLTPWLERKP